VKEILENSVSKDKRTRRNEMTDHDRSVGSRVILVSATET